MSNYTKEVAMQFHPRAFSAFGSDLVTNDSVAIAEIVKNSYDAFANNVTVDISNSEIVITDDGCGMTSSIIEEAWAVIATPYKKKNPVVYKGDKIRRVSGNKGLGRFSAARLGRYLEIITKNEADDLVVAYIDWESLVNSVNMADCKIKLTYGGVSPLASETGTIIKITGLYEEWNLNKISELQNALARLLSPFETGDDFSIVLNHDSYEMPIAIKPHDFIKKPTYSILGVVDENGDVSWIYKYAPKAVLKNRKDGIITWNDAKYGFDAPHTINKTNEDKYIAGKFEFEIRAWDLDSDSIGDVSETFEIGKREIRSCIAQYKGLSVYRDNILVLPKSDASKDWLGIDIRRVSQIGKRLSTSQIIGMVNISSEHNPEIKDTTDREKLVDTPEYKQFCAIIETIILNFENLRYIDKKPAKKEPRGLNDLIAPLSAAPLVAQIEDAISVGKTTDDIIETVRDYAAENEKSLIALNERLTYYAQTASLGSVAVVILHEILTGMTVIKRVLNRIRNKFINIDNKTQEYLDDAETSHSRLVEVANSFAPLYNKNLRNGKNICNVYDEIKKSIRLISIKKEAAFIEFKVDCPDCYEIPISSGELQTILVNLLDNAVYWINCSQNETKQIFIKCYLNNNKLQVSVSDSGMGILSEEAEKIFQPGITAKPNGIGMGLVIVTELLSYYDCKIATLVPGELGGATFEFELPLQEDKK